MKAIRVHTAGGPEALIYEDVDDPKAGAGQVVMKVEAIGLNFAEVNARRNANTAQGPVGIGGEAAGTILEVGADVQGFKAGDRVADWEWGTWLAIGLQVPCLRTTTDARSLNLLAELSGPKSPAPRRRTFIRVTGFTPAVRARFRRQARSGAGG